MPFHGPEVFILLTMFSWFVALGHCVINQKLRGGEKIAWCLFIFFTSWIGALVYFIFWYGFAKPKRSQTFPSIQQSYVPYQQSNSLDEQNEQNYPSYEQGYQPVRTPAVQVKPFINDVAEQEETVSPLYEQPQVMYPEDPR